MKNDVFINCSHLQLFSIRSLLSNFRSSKDKSYFLNNTKTSPHQLHQYISTPPTTPRHHCLNYTKISPWFPKHFFSPSPGQSLS